MTAQLQVPLIEPPHRLRDMASIKRSRDDCVSDDIAEDMVERSRSTSESAESEARKSKYASVEPESSRSAIMRCFMPPHKPMSFSTYEAYENHYQQDHANRCSECGKNLPSGHFLDLHIAENHDPIVASKREAGEKTFACFVEGCDKVCSEWQKRRRHLVDKHGFPRNYDFFIVNNGIDGRRSMLRAGIDSKGHRKSSRTRDRNSSSATQSTQSTEATSVTETDASPPASSARPLSSEVKAVAGVTKPEGGKAVDDITTSMSTLKMVPRSITFGQRKGRSGFAKN